MKNNHIDDHDDHDKNDLHDNDDNNNNNEDSTKLIYPTTQCVASSNLKERTKQFFVRFLKTTHFCFVEHAGNLIL